MNHKSLEDSFQWLRLPPLQGRPTWKGDRKLAPQKTGLPSKNRGSSLLLPHVCSPRVWSPYPNTAASPQCQPWLHMGLSKQIGLTTWGSRWRPAAAGAGLLQEVSWWIYSLGSISNTLTGQGSWRRTGLGWPHLCNWWEQTTELPQQLGAGIPASPAVVDGHHSPPWSWLRQRTEMTQNTNNTHSSHETHLSTR